MKLVFKASLIVAIFVIVPCRSDHFRGGTISWKPTGIRNEVEFKYKLGWRFNKGAGCTNSLIGNYVDAIVFPWNCVSGCRSSSVTLSSAGYICTAASITQDWEQGEYTFKHTFSSEGKFTVSYGGCCWIDLDYGSGNGSSNSWNLPTTVDLRTRSDLKVPNSSPVAAAKPIYIIKHGCTQTITLPVLDQDGDNVKCRWAAGDECSSVCRRIPNAVLDEDKCTLTISASGKKGDMYAVAVMVEDMPTSTITMNGETFTPKDVLSTVPIQFLVNTPDISSRSCSDRPVFVHPTPAESDILVVLPGKSLFVSFYASSRGTSISSFLLIGPPGVKQSSIRQLSLRPGVYSIDVTWTPSASDRGPQSLCAEATDAYMISSDMRCLTVAAWDINPCDSAPCQHNGTCSRVGYTQDFLCDCMPGYTGLQCQTDIDECASSPCQNGATCFDLINMYFCGCVSGYTDVKCQTDINECELRTCENGGTCHDHVNSAVCDCVQGFTGEICQTGIDSCESDPCDNGLCLYNATSGYECECSDGWYGRHCAIRHENETFHNETLMTTDYMHYSSCDCFFGHDKQELCYIYNNKKGIGFGALGVFLGVSTAILIYSIIELVLNKNGPCFHQEDIDDQLNIDDKEKENEKSKELKGDLVDHVDQKKEGVVTHRHRKCWACDVKYMRDPPAPWFKQ